MSVVTHGSSSCHVLTPDTRNLTRSPHTHTPSYLQLPTPSVINRSLAPASPAPANPDRGGSGLFQRGRLVDCHNRRPDASVAQAETGSILTERLDEMKLALPSHCKDVVAKSAVVDRIVQPVASSGFSQLTLELDIDDHFLSPGPFLGPGSDNALDLQVANEHSVHSHPSIPMSILFTNRRVIFIKFL